MAVSEVEGASFLLQDVLLRKQAHCYLDSDLVDLDSLQSFVSCTFVFPV